MKRILLALSIGVGVFTAATATTSNYGGSKKCDSMAKDTVPKKDTSTHRKDTMRLDVMAMPHR